MSSKFVVLTLTSDIVLVKNLQERTKSFVSEFQFVPVSDGSKLAEYAAKYPSADAVLIDDAFVDPLNAALVSKVRSAFSQDEAVHKLFFSLSIERNIDEIKKIMVHGFSDVFTKPVDASLLFQRLQIHFPKKQFLKDKLLFSMSVDSSLSLMTDCQLVSASEYGATIRLSRPLVVGDLFVLQGAIFGQQTGQCAGRVMGCSSRESGGGQYEATLLFIAPSKEILSAIRLWMKQEYVRTREAEV